MRARSAAMLKIWAGAASIGDRICYHVGSLGGMSPAGREARRLSAAGMVFLFQRRLPDGRFEYFAQRLSEEAGRVLRPQTWEEEL